MSRRAFWMFHFPFEPAEERRRDARICELASEHGRGAWLFMRRLGVLECDLDDAMQDLLGIVAERLNDIEAGKEKAFVMGVAYRIASQYRRRRSRRREVGEEEAPERIDPDMNLDDLSDHARARRLLDRLLEELPIELRAPLTLAEIDGCTLDEISELLSIPRGTVASRLRKAREVFDSSVRRLHQKTPSRAS